MLSSNLSSIWKYALFSADGKISLAICKQKNYDIRMQPKKYEYDMACGFCRICGHAHSGRCSDKYWQSVDAAHTRALRQDFEPLGYYARTPTLRERLRVGFRMLESGSFT